VITIFIFAFLAGLLTGAAIVLIVACYLSSIDESEYL
jgi:hypothetical protein